MITNTTILPSTKRVAVVDVLRGFSIVAIALLHAIEHFNFYKFPPADTEWLRFADKVTWDSLFFLFGGKAYAIFALLFGFTFFIQEQNAIKKAKDIRWPFMWRMLLLFLIAQVNAAFFTGEVLVLYALVAFVLPLFCRCSDKTIFWIALVLMLQPMEWGYMLYALFNPDYVVAPSLGGPYWKVARAAQEGGNFLEMVKANLWAGQMASLTWAFENARFFQTPSLFLLGYLMGRRGLLSSWDQHKRFWITALIAAMALFFALHGLSETLKGFVENPAIMRPMQLILTSIYKAAFMAILVASVVILYNSYQRVQNGMAWMIPFGKMSLTSYIVQSIIGGAIFYNWGLKLEIGAFYSVLVGVLIVLFQYFFSKFWLQHYKQGPFEWLWRKGSSLF